MTPNDVLAAGYRMSAQLFHRMVDDLTPEEFQRQPVPGANSAAWVVGHLALVARNSARRLGATDLPEFPAHLETKLQTTKQAAEEQTAIGDANVLLAVFDTCLEKLLAKVRLMPAETLAGEPSFRGPFATNMAEGILFGAIHIAMHTGQLSTIRRSLGKPPLV
jgi:DinB superfamily